MNQERRQRISEAYETLCKCQAAERDYLRKMPEGLLAEIHESAEVIDELENAIQSVSNIPGMAFNGKGYHQYLKRWLND